MDTIANKQTGSKPVPAVPAVPANTASSLEALRRDLVRREHNPTASPGCPLVAATVRLDTDNGSGGTGVIVAVEHSAPGDCPQHIATVLTCRHCFDGVRAVSIRFSTFGSTRAYTGHVLAVDDVVDLAAVRCACPEATVAVRIAETEPAAGSSIVQVGYPGDAPYPVKRTATFYGSTRGTGKLAYQTDLLVGAGDSGSGLFIGSELFGIISRMERATVGQGIAGGIVPLSEVRRFIATLLASSHGLER